ncbi:MAG: DUF58 domain-containing protein [Thermoprotei archaeon]
MSSGKARLPLVVPVLIIVSSLYVAVVLGDYPHLVYGIVAATLYAYLRGFPRLLAGFSWCLISVGVTPASTIASVSVSAISPLMYVDAKREVLDELLSLKLSSLALVFAPLYLLRPLSLIPATSYLASILALTFASYLRLSKSRVILEKSTYSIYLGEAVEARLKVEVSEAVSYSVLVNSSLSVRGFLTTPGTHDLVIKLLPKTAGIHSYVVKVVMSDLRRFSRITHGPYLIRVKTIPKSASIVRSVRELLARYVSLVKPPTVYVGRLEIVANVLTPGEVGKSGSEVGSGSVGIGSLGVGEGVAEGTGELSVGAERKLGPLPRYRVRWVVATRILEFIERLMLRALVGEYAGVREYSPGDHPRNIHWKKSVSLGKLVSKVFSSSGEGGGGRSSLVVADWDASNPIELDNLIQATYGALLTEARLRILYLRLPNGKIYLVVGELLDVLTALDSIMSSEEIESRFSYESWVRREPLPTTEELEKAGEPLKSLASYYTSLAESIVEELEKQGLPKGSSFIVIHPRAYAIKYSYLTRELVKRGYSVTRLREALQPSEVSKKLRESLASLSHE